MALDGSRTTVQAFVFSKSFDLRTHTCLSWTLNLLARYSCRPDIIAIGEFHGFYKYFRPNIRTKGLLEKLFASFASNESIFVGMHRHFMGLLT